MSAENKEKWEVAEYDSFQIEIMAPKERHIAFLNNDTDGWKTARGIVAAHNASGLKEPPSEHVDSPRQNELLPCPWCSSPRWGLAELDPGFQVICMQCFARGPEKLEKADAYASWNKRAIAAPVTPKSEEESEEKQWAIKELDGGRALVCHGAFAVGMASVTHAERLLKEIQKSVSSPAGSSTEEEE